MQTRTTKEFINMTCLADWKLRNHENMSLLAFLVNL